MDKKAFSFLAPIRDSAPGPRWELHHWTPDIDSHIALAVVYLWQILDPSLTYRFEALP